MPSRRSSGAARLAVLVVTSLNKPQYFQERAIPLAEKVFSATPGLHFFASDGPVARAEAKRRNCVARPAFAGDDRTLACPELKGAPLTLVECADVKWGAAGPCCKADAALAHWRRDANLHGAEYVILSDDDMTWEAEPLVAALDDFSQALEPDAAWVSGNRAHGHSMPVFWRVDYLRALYTARHWVASTPRLRRGWYALNRYYGSRRRYDV